LVNRPVVTEENRRRSSASELRTPATRSYNGVQSPRLPFVNEMLSAGDVLGRRVKEFSQTAAHSRSGAAVAAYLPYGPDSGFG
jgi:hypothetical protein